MIKKGAFNFSVYKMKRFIGFERGMALGAWLTNYKRMGKISPEWRNNLTKRLQCRI